MKAPVSRVTPQLAARRKAVHAACRQLGMDDDARRDFMHAHAGVRSTNDLDLHGCQRVLDAARKVGATRPAPEKYVGRHPGYPETCRRGCGALLEKVEALLADMKLPWAYATATLRQMHRNMRLEWATARQLHDLVAALVVEQKKRHMLEAVTSLARALGRTDSDLNALARWLAPVSRPLTPKWQRDLRYLEAMAETLSGEWAARQAAARAAEAA
ncbi:phage protein GemA/Gp16 family protein [Methyloversatilis universalis]|nr:phage protein GemA/Gp16 family protein [Methyloversatilis universalis]